MSIVNEQGCSASSEVAPPAGRKLRLKARAERMAETRDRIARAAYELHASIGPARTTISAIAERAGVQRLTVYKHFPHDRDIFQACTGYFLTLDPPPDPTAWGQVADPRQRLRRALAELYAYFRRNESLFENVQRDLPVILEQVGGAPPPNLQANLAQPTLWRDALAAGWPDDAEHAPLRRAALGLAVGFHTWQTLVRQQGLDDVAAVDLMAALVECAASPH